MATKNLELAKTKLINKLYEVRHDVETANSTIRHKKTIERTKTLEKRYSVVVKKSLKDLVIGKDIIDDNFSYSRNVNIDDIENFI